MQVALVLLVIALLAGAPRAHATFPGANGRLAFSAETRFAGSAQNAVLWDYNSATRKRRQLTKRGQTCGLGSSTSFANDWVDGGLDYSPDGRWITYLHADNCPGGESREGLWIMRADGTAQRRLSHIGLYWLDIVNGFEAAFSRDGRNIAVIHDTATPSGVYALSVFSTTDGAVQRQVVLSGSSRPDGLDWGINGRVVASLNQRLHVMSPDGSGRRRLTARRIGYWEDSAPDWSPGARSLAFLGTRWSGDSVIGQSIWRGFVRRAKAVRLTHGGLPHSPTFSPDGRRLAVATTTGIASIPSRGGGAVRTLIRARRPIQSVWSVSWQPRPPGRTR